jgi:hypothetical protein
MVALKGYLVLLIYRMKRNVMTAILYILLAYTLRVGRKGFGMIIKCNVIMNCEYYGIGEEVRSTLRYVASSCFVT